VVYDVESGNTLGDAFSKHPKAFSGLYLNMVAAGKGAAFSTRFCCGWPPSSRRSRRSSGR
jgi:hypothetical protein